MNASRPQPGGRRPRARTKRTRPKRKNARKWQTHARKRGIQRWSSLLTAESSRLAKANSMRQFLGERCWDSIVQCANKHYREAFLQSFTPHDGVLRCKGPLSSISGSTKCPQGFRVAVRHLGLRCDAGDGPPRIQDRRDPRGPELKHKLGALLIEVITSSTCAATLGLVFRVNFSWQTAISRRRRGRTHGKWLQALSTNILVVSNASLPRIKLVGWTDAYGARILERNARVPIAGQPWFEKQIGA
jgi:hypothetical protein